MQNCLLTVILLIRMLQVIASLDCYVDNLTIKLFKTLRYDSSRIVPFHNYPQVKTFYYGSQT